MDHITKLETIHMVTGRMTASYEYIYNEEGYIVKEIVKETVVSQWFEEMYDILLDTILSGIDIDNYDIIKQAWKKFYDAHHIFCDHDDADGDGKYEYNSASQLISRTNQRLWTDNVTYYTYDADGNLISEQTGCFEKTYEYTAENRLSVVKAQGTVLMAALYDGDGNRLFTMDYTGENNDRWDIWIPECGGNADKVDDSAKDTMRELASLVSRKDRRDYTITEYVNDITRENEEVLAELNHRGKVTTAYTYGYNRESADVYGDTQYFLYDGQGNVSRISSEWGRVKETYSYDPYGNLTYGIPDTVNYYGYNGESSNLATGLQYLRARYYSPQNGNFITEDTYAGQISNPLTLNRYDYVSNNPLNYVDPSGHYSLKQFGKDIGNFANKVGTAIGDGLETIGRGILSFGNEWNAYQQSQQYEHQLVAELVTGNLNKPQKETSKSEDKNDKIASKIVQKLDEDKGKNKDSSVKVSPDASEVPQKNTNLADAIVDAAAIQVAAQKERDIAIKEAEKKFCEGLENWAEKNIGKETSTIIINKESERREFIFKIEEGNEIIYTPENEEDSSKAIVHFTQYDHYHKENIISLGTKYNLGIITKEVSYGVNECSTIYNWNNGSETKGVGIRLDIWGAELGVEFSTSYQIEDGTEKVYKYISIDKWSLPYLVLCMLPVIIFKGVPAYAKM